MVSLDRDLAVVTTKTETCGGIIRSECLRHRAVTVELETGSRHIAYKRLLNVF